MKYKNVYTVFFTNKGGMRAQPVKGNTAKEARGRFRKKYPARKYPILSVTKDSAERYHVIAPI